MNQIKKSPVDKLGYGFIMPDYLPKGKNEYYLRNQQNDNGITYRQLSAFEIEMLVRNRNTSDDWNNILVSDAFNPELVQNCKFFGLVRIGKLEPIYLEFRNLKRPVGFYNSTIISSDFGDNVVIDNVNYLSHYIIGSDVMIVNTNEIATTDRAKFGTGIIKEGEQEDIRIWLQVCNENGGRQIIPFDGMLPGDAYLWTRNRDNIALQEKFKSFTQAMFDERRGYYGTIGDRTVIKNCRIIKDVRIGTDAYLKGANKIKNVAINSSAESKSQIGEGCELVNGIVDYGCRIFYGVKAVRFYIATHSQLKYGARLINSYLGDNSTISCCEVLNSLIFPSHEQHHNNSFLCAALVEGQSNMAAGATIGSNHNSRSPDGELRAGRGFWPGLCVSLKHNSKFASYTILAKGDYPAELNIPIPFSLVSNDIANDSLQVMPGYWFMYNMYALARNSWKYTDRDQRKFPKQHLEFNFLAPDTINEMLRAQEIIERATIEALERSELLLAQKQGRNIFQSKTALPDDLEITVNNFENTNRKTILLKVSQAWNLFNDLIHYYIAQQFISFLEKTSDEVDTVVRSLKLKMKSAASRNSETPVEWTNVGGQLIPKPAVDGMVADIVSGKVKGWKEVHAFYKTQENRYSEEKLLHALTVLNQFMQPEKLKLDKQFIADLLVASITTREWMVNGIRESRAKDYGNPFRMMVYENADEMNVVTGKLSDNSFINKELADLKKYKRSVGKLVKKFSA